MNSCSCGEPADGPFGRCTACHFKITTEECKTDRIRDRENRQYTDAYLRNHYGISIQQYDAMLLTQNGVCKICKLLPGGVKLHVDHCHTTGVVRGLLCRGCNPGLGCFQDSPERLRAAADYLEATNTLPSCLGDLAHNTLIGLGKPPN